MRIEVESIGLAITEALRVHSEHIIRAAVSGFYSRIGHVVVTFTALSPAPGFPNIECRIRVVIIGRRNISNSFRSSNIFTAVDGAADRISKSLASKLSHVNEFY